MQVLYKSVENYNFKRVLEQFIDNFKTAKKDHFGHLHSIIAIDDPILSQKLEINNEFYNELLNLCDLYHFKGEKFISKYEKRGYPDLIDTAENKILIPLYQKNKSVFNEFRLALKKSLKNGNLSELSKFLNKLDPAAKINPKEMEEIFSVIPNHRKNGQATVFSNKALIYKIAHVIKKL